MNKLTFKEIINCTGGVSSYFGDDFFVTNITFDSRENVKGSMFIAFVTEKDNGHRYISVAANKGAIAAIVSEDIDVDIPLIKVNNTRKAYQDIACFYRNKFSIPVIAITGSNGKTTVKDMLTSILSIKYRVLSTEKNLNNELGVPQTILKLNSRHEVMVIEMGMNHRGEIRTLTNIVKPNIAVITKIGTAHIGNLGGTRADVFQAKMEIIEGLKKDGVLVLCGDDDMLSTINEGSVVFSGLSNDGRNILYASNILQFWDENECGLMFWVHYQGNKYNCFLPMLGRHNVQNTLLALTVGIQVGIPVEDAIESLRFYPRSSMRLEISVIHGVKFIKDYYNASPESSQAALDTLAELKTTGSHIAIFGDMLELGEESQNLHRNLAEYTIGKADKVFYVGKFKDAFLLGRGDACCYETKEELNFALSSAILNGEISYGDIILIKGSNDVKMCEQYEFLQRLLEQGSIISAQTRLLVDVDALKYNYAVIKNYIGEKVKIMPVVKADAYGTGASLLANIYNDCHFFAVADLREAEKLHAAIPTAKILVLYQPLSVEVDLIVGQGEYVVTSVGDANFVRALNKAASKAGKKLFVHIEIDTGMSRLGVLVEDCEELAKVIANCTNLVVEGIFTHYSSADMYREEDLEYTAMQTKKFKKAIKLVESILGDIPLKHACASAAIFNPKAELFDMVRPGYILHGYYPCNEIKNKIILKPALKYVTQVTQIKEFDEKEKVSVSYGRSFVTKRKTRLAEIPVGYSDGIMRKLSKGGAFVIKGQLAPIVGNVTMDYTMVDVTDIEPIVWVGDEVFIFDNVNMTVEHMAELCDTIGYEIITSIKDKADKIEIF